MNNNINDTGQQVLTLFVPIFVIASLSFLVLIDSTENDVYAQTTSSNTTITTSPATKTFQNPIDAKTGQEIIPPTSAFVEIDKETGQPSKTSDIYQKDPIIQGQSAEKTTTQRPTPNLPTQYGSQLDQFQILQPSGSIQDK